MRRSWNKKMLAVRYQKQTTSVVGIILEAASTNESLISKGFPKNIGSEVCFSLDLIEVSLRRL